MTNREIAELCLRDEAESILSLILQLDEQFDNVVELILNCHGKVIVTGVGKSGHIGAKIASTLSSTGTPAFYVNPLDFYHGDLGVITHADIVIAISNSGQTDDLLRFIPFLTEENIPLVAMTGNPDSLLARNSNYHLSIAINREACPLNLAPTNSTTATLALGDALACALMKQRHFGERDFAKYHPGGSLGKRLLTKACDVMHREDLPVITPETLMGDAIIHVSKGRLGMCVVVENEKILGIITDGDIRRAMQSQKEKFFYVPVSNVMTRSPKCVGPETKISEIQRVLQENKIHAVLVLDDRDCLLGIVDSFSCAL